MNLAPFMNAHIKHLFLPILIVGVIFSTPSHGDWFRSTLSFCVSRLDKRSSNVILEPRLPRADLPIISMTTERTADLVKALTDLDIALNEGLTIVGWSTTPGVRMIVVEDSLGIMQGYGEHPNVEEALIHAAEDYVAGGREYDQVYGEGKMYPAYLIGEQIISSALDHWVLQGNTLQVSKRKHTVTAKFIDYRQRVISTGQGHSLEGALRAVEGPLK